MKMKIRFSLITLLITLVCSSVMAQQTDRYQLEGRAVEASTNKGIGYATIALLKADSSIVAAVAADATGAFTIAAKEQGRYMLQISSVGYTTHNREVELVEGKTKLGKVVLEQGIDISEVVVAVQKPLIVADDEKIAYSVEDDPDSATSQVVDIMRKVPQLSVDAEGNVLLNGQSDYKVLVNGRSSSMMSKNFKSVIESMPAGSVKKIEVITNPSTKYEAEGVGGIINIITDRKVAGGYNGNVNISGSTQYFLNGNAYIAAQAGKFSISASAYMQGIKSRLDHRGEGFREVFDDPTMHLMTSSTGMKYNGRYLGAYFNASYEIDTMNLITLEGGYHNGKNRSNANSKTEIFSIDNERVMAYDNYLNSHYNYNSYWAAANYQRTFNRQDHTLTVSYEMDLSPDKEEQLYDVLNTFNYPTSSRRNLGDNGSFDNTVQIDYFNPINKVHSIEAGTKYIYRRYTNESQTLLRDEATGEFAIAPDYPRSDMNYTQNILALYAGYHVKGKKLSGRVGARMEQAWSDVAVVTEKDKITYDPSLFNVIPYASANYRPNDANTLSLSYTQRLSRPNLWHMNPYRNESPLNVSYGNPDLDATLAHSVALSWRRFSSSWNISLGTTGSFSNNALSSYSFVEDGVTHSTYDNIAKRQIYGLNGTIGYRSGVKFNVQLSGQGGYNVIKAPALNLENDGFTYNVSLYASAALWKDATIYCNGYAYRFGVDLENSFKQTYFSYGLGLRQQLFKKKLTLSFTASNPFNANSKLTQVVQTNTYRSENTSWQTLRQFSFSIGYRFGKSQVNVKSTNRSIQNDDMESGSRGGNSGGGQQGM
ncbi:MAG: outer membrane beta-barrel protein [Rikenellaceae bacterium]|nr:outer membrane beta-barrel protein [Rikenellaceae bacterium]